jgi:hypothetical protein
MVNGRGATVSPGGSGGCAELEGGGAVVRGGGYLRPLEVGGWQRIGGEVVR